MKQHNKLRTASLLMTISILLLVILQGYWLRNAWFDEYRRLKRELSVMLREAVMQQQFEHFTQLKLNDSIAGVNHDSGIIRFQRFKGNNDKTTDSSPAKTNIIINFTGDDSLRFPGSPGMISIEQERQNDAVDNSTNIKVDFPAMFGDVNLDSVKKNYSKSVMEAGYNRSFSLRIVPRNASHRTGRGEMKINNAGKRAFRSEVIEADFGNPYLLLLRKIQWQLFFAVMMIVVTTVAFIFLYQNLRQQQRLADIKNEFISNISHELKTPIATVSVAIEALKNFDAISDAEKTKAYLDISSNELQRLNLLVDRVLKLSLFEQQQVTMQFEKLDMQLLLQEVLNSMKLQFEKEAAKAEFKTSGTNFFTSGDRMHLISVFYNLLDNALKYSPDNPQIAVLLKTQESKLFISISDNGIGIPEAYRNKIFDKFFRVPHGNTHNIKGYGLGLSYVQEVIQQHSGSITVENSEEGGTVFTVVLNRAGV